MEISSKDRKRLKVTRAIGIINYNQKKDSFLDKMQKKNFKNIREALTYAYERPGEVDYNFMKEFIYNSGLIEQDYDLELFKSSYDVFFTKEDADQNDINFINDVLFYGNALSINNFYARMIRNKESLSEFDVYKNYETIRNYIDFVKENSDSNLLNGLLIKDRVGYAGLDRLNALQKEIKKGYPGISEHYKDILTYKYSKDGKPLTFDEQMLAISASDEYTLDYDFLRKMIKESGNFTREKSLVVLDDITKYRIMSHSGRDLTGKHFFINDVYKDNINDLLDVYEQQLSNSKEMDIERVSKDYQSATRIIETYSKPSSRDISLDALNLGLYNRDDKSRKNTY